MIIRPLTNNNSFLTTWESGMVVFIQNNSFKPTLNDRVYIDLGEFFKLKKLLFISEPSTPKIGLNLYPCTLSQLAKG